MEAKPILDALYSRVAILPGGRSREKKPLLVVNASFANQPSNRNLEIVLKYFTSIFSADTRRSGLCVIIDAQRVSWRMARSVIHSVWGTLQSEIALVLVIRPEAFWDKKKVENCARSKQEYETIYVPFSRLYKYVNGTHLPEEFGGSWVYNHKHWIDNRIKVEEFVKKAEGTISELEVMRNHLNNTEAEFDNVKDFAPSRSKQFYNVKENTLVTVTSGNALIEQLEKSHTEQQQHLVMIPQDIIDTKDRINRLVQIIQGKMALLDEAWTDARKRFENAKEVCTIEDGVCQVTNWILGPGESLLNSQQDVGYDVTSAEFLRKNHETLELKCREPYGHYAKLLHKLEILSKNRIKFPEDLTFQKDFMDFVCRSFATRVERRRNILITSARFFRLVSEYFQTTSSVYENLVMGIDIEDLNSTEHNLKQLQQSQTNIITMEKELMKEGEKLSDLLSMPVKDALGRELAVNYQDEILNVREILNMTISRRQLFRDSVKLQMLTLQKVTHIRNYEKNAAQAIEWLEKLYKVMLKSNSHVGCDLFEIQRQKEEHQHFQETAKGTFEFGCHLLKASLVLRQSCKLEESVNVQLTERVRESWKKLYAVSQEQLTRLRVSAVFHRNIDHRSKELNDLIQMLDEIKLEVDEGKKWSRFADVANEREKILLEVGRMIRLGRLLKIRLREPLCPENCTDEVNDDNETAIEAICEKLSEATFLAEQLDTSLCSLRNSMKLVCISGVVDENGVYLNSEDKNDAAPRSSTNFDILYKGSKSECENDLEGGFSKESSVQAASEDDDQSSNEWWDMDVPNFSDILHSSELSSDHSNTSDVSHSSDQQPVNAGEDDKNIHQIYIMNDEEVEKQFEITKGMFEGMEIAEISVEENADEDNNNADHEGMAACDNTQCRTLPFEKDFAKTFKDYECCFKPVLIGNILDPNVMSACNATSVSSNLQYSDIIKRSTTGVF